MFIQFGILNKKHLTIFITPFILALERFFNNKHETNNPFYKVGINFLSLIICGNIYLISIFLTKSEKENYKRYSPNISEQKSINNNKSEKSKWEPSRALSRSARPRASSREWSPNEARISRTSSARKRK